MPDQFISNPTDNNLEMLTLRLGRANGFNLDSLAANCGGKLNAQQKARFLSIFLLVIVVGLIFAILLIVSFV